ncbi:MAG TPA: SAV_915 family protein, partial [Phytomonospora sp.]
IDAVVVRTGRLPAGDRVGLAFTRLDRLAAAMGDAQRWTRLSESALRAMLAPLGLARIQVDPVAVAPDIAVPARAPVTAETCRL